MLLFSGSSHYKKGPFESDCKRQHDCSMYSYDNKAIFPYFKYSHTQLNDLNPNMKKIWLYVCKLSVSAVHSLNPYTQGSETDGSAG